MGHQSIIDIDMLFPASEEDARDRLSSFSVLSFLGDSPLTATLIVPGTADGTAASLHAMQLPQYPKMLQRAQTLYDAQLAYYRGELETAERLGIGRQSHIDDALRRHEISAEWIKNYPKG